MRCGLPSEQHPPRKPCSPVHQDYSFLWPNQTLCDTVAMQRYRATGSKGRQLVKFRECIDRLFGIGSRSGKPGAKETPHTMRAPRDAAGQEQTRRDASGHEGILSEEFARTLEAADRGLSFPEGATDPIEYLGNVDPLGLSDHERETVRQWTRELLEERGDRAVWNSRLRLKLELRYLISEGGLYKMPGEKGTGRRG